jgi:hypothetical protein
MQWNTMEELIDLQLSLEATLNVWCDKQVEVTRHEDITY